MSTYPGGKGGAGVYQTIINEMPPHDRYIEPFVGGGSILLRKKPARESLVADLDPAIAAHWSTIAASGGMAGLTAVCADARSIIAALRDSDARTLIYCDPPYVRSARRSPRPIYAHEFTDDDHRSLLSLLLTVKASVMLSGYRNPIYDQELQHWRWRRIDFKAQTRGGPATESLWCNFRHSAARHDYGYVGADFRERERIKRKKDRWRARLAGMSALERAAILAALLDPASPETTTTAAGAGAHRHRRREDPARSTSTDDGGDAAGAAPFSAQSSGPEHNGP